MSYVDERFYDDLVSSFSSWDAKLPVQDPGLKERCRGLLEREARLLDQQRYDEWLALRFAFSSRP